MDSFFVAFSLPIIINETHQTFETRFLKYLQYHIVIRQCILSGVLEALGKAKYIQLLTNAGEWRIVIRAAAYLEDQPFEDPPYTYEDCSLVFSQPELIAGVKGEVSWDDDVYAVECFLVKDRDRNLVVLADLNTAVPSEQPVGPFTVPQVFDEDVADDNGRYP